MAFRFCTNIQEVDDEEIARFGTLHSNRAAQEVDDGEVDVTNIVGGVVVLNEAAGPIVGLNDEVLAGFHPCNHGDVRVPAVVDHVIFVRALGEVDFDDCFRHWSWVFLNGPVKWRQRDESVKHATAFRLLA
jgi:hypothetical protein